MSFVTNDLDLSTLYSTVTPIEDSTLWATTYATNHGTYFLKGAPTVLTPDTFNYTFITLAPSPTLALWTANILALYSDTSTVDKSVWGDTLGGYIIDYYTTILFTGTKQLIATPFTVSPWIGVVSNTTGTDDILKQTLTAIYDPPGGAQQDVGEAFRLSIESAISTFASTCYVDNPTFLLS